MNIYLNDETNFERNGLGFLTECISANVTESLNGDYILQIEYPLNAPMSEYLVEDNIIKANVGNNNYQLFRINRVTKDFETIQVYALHISYDLLNNMLVDVYPQNLTCEAYGNWLLNNTQYSTNFTFQSDISTSASGRYIRRNPIDAIMGNEDNSMINLFGGEIERDNFIVKLLQSRGANNGVKLLFGKNITEIKTIVDITSMYTRIMPIGYDGLLLPEKFVDSPIINNYPTPRITKVEFSNIAYDPTGEQEGAYTDIDDAYNALRLAVRELYNQGIDKPQITIKIDWLELSKTEQYKTMYSALEKVNLGDTITAEILGLDYTTKVTKTIYNVLTDTIDNFEIGTIQQTIANSINSNAQAIQQVNPSSILSQAKTDATNLINSALGGYIYLDYDTGNLYIMDTDDPSTAQKIWRWNLNGLGYSSTGINGTYGIAMTMDGQIVADFITTGTLNTNVIQGYDSLTTQVQTNTANIGDRSLKSSTITQDIDSLEAQIGDIADITTSSETTDAMLPDTDFQNIETSYPININIHPTSEQISYLYPKESGSIQVGNTTQDSTTAGKNLFDKSLPAFANYYTTLTELSTGVRATISGTGTNRYSCIKLNAKELLGKTITISATITPSSSNNGAIRLYYLKGTQLTTKIGDNLNETGNVQITIPSTYTNENDGLAIVFSSNRSGTATSGDYVDYTNVQLEVGSATTYEPFVPNSPSPDYPQPINNVTGEQVVEIAGKNLYNPSYRRQNGTIFVNAGTGTEENGTFRLTATGSDLYIWNVISAGKIYDESRGQLYEFKEDSYTVSISNPLFIKNFVTYYDKNGVSLGYTQKARTTFNVLKSEKAGAKYFAIRIGYGQAVSGTSYSFTVQLEKGIVSSPVYEPYIGHTYPINLGKNLFDKDNANVINRFINSNTRKIGTDANTRMVYIKCKPNTTYTVSKMLSARFMIGFTDDVPATDADVYGLQQGNNKTELTSTSGPQSQYIIAFLYHASYDTTITLEEIMATIQIEENPYATSYSPYKTPIELCKIGDYQDSIKKSTGKNLLNLSNKIVGYGFNNTNNIVVISSVHDIYYIPVEAGKTYVSSAVLGTSSGNIAYAYSSEIPQENTPVTGRTTTAISTLNNGTFIVPTGKKYLLIRLTRESQVLTNWQIEEGSQATTYEPYGKVWYKYSEIGSIVLDGSETGWQYADNYNYFRCPNYDFKGQIPLSTTEGQRNQLSTHFRLNWHWSGTDSFRDNVNVQGEFFSIYNINYKICIRNTNYTTTQDLKTWLASALPKIQYILETPTYEIITDTELIGQLDALLNAGLFPSDTLYPKVRTLRFTNTQTNEVFDYDLPDDLLYYDENTYDEFSADYETTTCQIIKRCKYEIDGSVSVLDTPVTTQYDFDTEIMQHFPLTEGNYKIELLGYTNGYMFVRLMVLNAYTAQYATKVELQSSLQQTATAITTQVSREYETKENAYTNYSQLQQTADELTIEVASKVGNDEIISKINQTAEQIKIQANKVNLQGYVTATDLSGTGTTTINGANITTGTISADRVSGGMLQGTTISGTNINGATINGGTISLESVGENARYTIKDYENGNCYYTQSARSIRWYGLNGGFFTIWNTGLPMMGLSYGDSSTNVNAWYIETPEVRQTSLESEKKNFERFNNALDIIKDVDIYKYNLKHQKDDEKKHIGFVIGDKYKYSHEITAVDENGNETGVDLYSMTSVCLQAIKEQQEIIEKLNKRIEVLENEK